MPLPSFRSSRSKVRRRRSHHALKAMAVTLCPKCQAVLVPHRACKKCGAYKERSVAKKDMVEVKKAIAKTTRKTTKKVTSSKPGHEGHNHE